MTTQINDPSVWAASLLKRLNIHQTPGAVQALTGWANAEGGNWHNSARYNPLNTTQTMPGSRTFRSVGQGAADIGIYNSWDQGLDATVKTLRNGRYGGILSALQKGDPSAVADAIGQTPWGTNADSVRKAIEATPLKAGVHAVDVPGSTQAPVPDDVASYMRASGQTSGTSTVTPRQPTVYDVIASYRAATQPPQATSNPTSSLLPLQNSYNPTTSGQQIQATVDKIKALRQPAQQALQTGDAHAAGISSNQDAPAAVASLIEEADKIDAAHMPYLWGGGHGAAGRAGTKLSPLDCSGAVSRVLGIDPRVSGDFQNWGDAGEGKDVTIYANPEHVLMKINGHFFGTSATNPGGGAGWIPQRAISKDYLKRFTARHPKGM